MKVDTAANNNRFYTMIIIPQKNIIHVEYGRVGAKAITKAYPVSAWDTLYEGKIKQGYHDTSELYSAEITTKNFKEIDDHNVNHLVNHLLDWAKAFIQDNYSVSIRSIDEKMVIKAENIIKQLCSSVNLELFNFYLNDLFNVIPRKMKNVETFLAHSSKDYDEIILREQDLLLALKSQVELNQPFSVNCNEQTVLELSNLEIESVSEKEKQQILSLLGISAKRYVNGYSVKNLRTEQNYVQYCAKEKISHKKLLFHGSRHENWWHILTQGLLITPHGAHKSGRMFGNGIYFANNAEKSLKYTSIFNSLYAHGTYPTGFIAVYEVALGESLHINKWNYEDTKINETTLRKMRVNSVYAHKGVSLVNDEFVVYNSSAATVKYLIELS